ncbi:hypothetical protein BH10PSE14_BH10PSE14_27640 [soil metagenome]
MMLHRVRLILSRQRTQRSNALRAHLAEFGIVAPIGRNGIDQLVGVMTLGADEFIRRFLLHALPRGFHRIRHYGLPAGATRKAHLERARQLLAVAPPAADDTPVEPSDARPPCPCCGGHMIIIEIFERRYQPRAPPYPSTSAGRQAS